MPTDQNANDIQQKTAEPGLLRFLKVNKSWWLLPLTIVFVVVSGLVLLNLLSGEHAVPTEL